MDCPAREGIAPAPAPDEGGAAAQVGQVRSLGSGVSQESDCSLAGAGATKSSLGPRIQLWEAGFVSQTLPRRKAMDGVRRGARCRLLCVGLTGSSHSQPEPRGKVAYAPPPPPPLWERS